MLFERTFKDILKSFESLLKAFEKFVKGSLKRVGNYSETFFGLVLKRFQRHVKNFLNAF